jgi:hypothetical protein
MKSIGNVLLRTCTVWLFVLACGHSIAGQQILIDKPVRAGELTLFPDLNDEKIYYYVSDKPKLATTAAGDVQFSFLRFVRNVQPAGASSEADGGGIFHAVVALSVSDEQLRDAQRELQRLKAGAHIQGPVVYNSGKFGLVSSFKNPQGNLVSQVVGLGSAPILDGEKAAVSIQLTKEGSQLLWDSFHTATPDISFSFEMEMTGFRSPHRAVIEANFDQIYEHQAFAAGLASTYLAAEIKGAFDDLSRQGAIKVTQVGEDKDQEALINTAYNKIADLMFSPAGGTGTPTLGSLGEIGGGGSSLLDRATTMLAKNREETRAKNTSIRARNDEAQKKNDEINKKKAEAVTADREASNLGKQLADTDARLAKLKEQADTAQSRANSLQAEADAAQARADALKKQAESDTSAQKQAQDAQSNASLLKVRAEAARSQAAIYKKYLEDGQKERTDLSKKAGDSKTKADSLTAAAPKDFVEKQEEQAEPSFAVVGTYEMKRVHQRGIFKVDLNKYTTDKLTMRFDENIGDLRSMLDNKGHFLLVNMDDPAYLQRLITVSVDGENAQQFANYVNFVSVRLHKRHAHGAESTGEVQINRNTFNQEANNFKMMYGWKDDADREQWFEYEYQPVWSFFGGKTVEVPWQRATANGINLRPPLQRVELDLQATPDTIAKAQVRAITVKVFYNLGSGELVRQKTLNAAKNQLSDRIDFLLPQDKTDYEYEIIWQLPGNRAVSSGRHSNSTTFLSLDDLPSS